MTQAHRLIPCGGHLEVPHIECEWLHSGPAIERIYADIPVPERDEIWAGIQTQCCGALTTTHCRRVSPCERTQACVSLALTPARSATR